MKLLIAGTGHRPDKIGGWDNIPAFHRTVSLAVEALEELEPAGIVSGGAAGWDLALAHAALELDIPLLMAVPFNGQEGKWSPTWQQIYGEAIDRASVVELISDLDVKTSTKHEIVKALHGRNVWMVEYIKKKRGKILALWNGTPGGTAHCVRAANRAGIDIINLWGKLSQTS